MLRLFNVVALICLVGSAISAYSVKYDTIFYVEQAKKIETQIDRARDAVALLKAEWQFLNKPTRVQSLADKYLNVQPLTASQIVRASELPNHKYRPDAIAEKLEDLGIVTGATPNQGLKSSGRTPGSGGVVK